MLSTQFGIVKEKLKLTLYTRKILLITTNEGYKICKQFYTHKDIKIGIDETECQKNNL